MNFWLFWEKKFDLAVMNTYVSFPRTEVWQQDFNKITIQVLTLMIVKNQISSS